MNFIFVPKIEISQETYDNYENLRTGCAALVQNHFPQEELSIARDY